MRRVQAALSLWFVPSLNYESMDLSEPEFQSGPECLKVGLLFWGALWMGTPSRTAQEAEPTGLFRTQDLASIVGATRDVRQWGAVRLGGLEQEGGQQLARARGARSAHPASGL